jgi:hypothetical protein
MYILFKLIKGEIVLDLPDLIKTYPLKEVLALLDLKNKPL